MQNKMLGRACFPPAPAASGRPRPEGALRAQPGQASAAPVTFKKDRLDIRVCSIDIVPCVAIPRTQVFYQPTAGPLHDTQIRPFGKQAIDGGPRTV